MRTTIGVPDAEATRAWKRTMYHEAREARKTTLRMLLKRRRVLLAKLCSVDQRFLRWDPTYRDYLWDLRYDAMLIRREISALRQLGGAEAPTVILDGSMPVGSGLVDRVTVDRMAGF